MALKISGNAFRATCPTVDPIVTGSRIGGYNSMSALLMQKTPKTEQSTDIKH